MKTITVASAQYPVTEHLTFDAWELHIRKWIKEAKDDHANLLLFPEYGSMELVSLFPDHIRSDIRGQLQAMQGLLPGFCKVFEEEAIKHGLIIVAPSFPVQVDDKIYNRAFVFSPAGRAGYQDKFFMTRFENEEWGIHAAPKQLSLFETSWGNFGIQICYDAEFSLGSQLLCSAGASLILAPSCTETIRGATRVHVGARARALENQAYAVVSQTVGDARWSPAVDINYGFAAFYSTPDQGFPEEGILAQMPPQLEGWLIQELDMIKISEVRKDGQVLNFNDHQSIHTGLQNEEINLLRIRV